MCSALGDVRFVPIADIRRVYSITSKITRLPNLVETLRRVQYWLALGQQLCLLSRIHCRNQYSAKYKRFPFQRSLPTIQAASQRNRSVGMLVNADLTPMPVMLVLPYFFLGAPCLIDSR